MITVLTLTVSGSASRTWQRSVKPAMEQAKAAAKALDSDGCIAPFVEFIESGMAIVSDPEPDVMFELEGDLDGLLERIT